MPLVQADKIYSYEDYITWRDEERWEIVDGVAYMQAAPTWQHQAISRELIIQFGNYLRDKECNIFSSPFDLILTEDENEKTSTNVFQPDIVLVCDKDKLKGTGYVGVPPLVIEIVSPSTARNDKLYKFNIYEKFGVGEYWIIEPDIKMVSVFALGNNRRYGRPEIYTDLDSIKVGVLKDLTINLEQIFEGGQSLT